MAVKYQGKSRDFRKPTLKTSSRSDRGKVPTAKSPFSINYLNPLYDFSEGEVEKAAKSLGISNINKREEVERIVAILKPKEGSNTTQETEEPKNSPRNTGKFEDIQGALGEDANKGMAVADYFRSLAVPTSRFQSPYSNSSMLERAYQGVAGGVDIFTESIGKDGTNYGVGFGPGDLRRARADGYSDASIRDFLQRNYGDHPIAQPIFDELRIGQPSGPSAYEQMMAEMRAQQERANAAMQQQLAAANAARQAAEQRAANMRNAFVPQANPTATSAGYGDQRKSFNRDTATNALSSMTILSGLGTASSPLAGLQLA